MKKIVSKLFVLILTIASFVGFSNIAFADDGDVGFTVVPHIQENQINTGNSFFDIKVTPGQEVNLSFDIVNSSGKDQVFDIEVNPAYTNDAGQIDYVDKDHKRDSTLKVDLAKIATYDKEATVGAGQTVTIPVKINVPAEAFKGEVLGGIHVTRRTAKGEQEGAQLVNKFAYVIGFRMMEDEADVKRDLKMLDVKAGLYYHHTSVKATMQNPEPTSMGKLTYKATVTPKGEDKAIKEQESKDLSMAPNSSFDYVIDWKNEELEAGDYHLHLVVTDAKDNKWEFDKDFTITAKEAQKYNASAVDLVEKEKFPWIYVILGVLAALVVGLLLYIILSKRKKDDEEQKTDGK